MNAEKMSKYEVNDDVVAGASKECERVSELHGFAGSLLKRTEKKADLTQFKFHLIVPINLNTKN